MVASDDLDGWEPWPTGDRWYRELECVPVYGIHRRAYGDPADCCSCPLTTCAMPPEDCDCRCHESTRFLRRKL
jgi:hypothetical protein